MESTQTRERRSDGAGTLSLAACLGLLMSDPNLLVNLVYALGVAVVGATIAIRLGQPAIVGYIIGGIAIGPHTPGFVGDIVAVEALADIGVILLMFAIGVQLSLRDLLQVGRVASAGGILQVAALIAAGYAVGTALGWPDIEALFFGAFISNSSSTVLSKVLNERGELDAPHANLSLAWSSVQDFSTVALVVILTSLATGEGGLGGTILVSLFRALLFLALLVPLGLKVLPWFLERLAGLHSRELFVLAVAALALGAAYVSSLFGLSLALGAFVAGVVVGESDLSHQILGAVSPLRDVFAGMFFVSVGMLANPGFVVGHAGSVLGAVSLIVLVKSGLVAAILGLAGHPFRTALLTGVGLAQSAEFSFILARVGAGLGVVSAEMFSLMLSAAAVSIALSPYLIRSAAALAARIERLSGPGEGPKTPVPALKDHTVICGFGRVGRVICQSLAQGGHPFVVIEQDQRLVRELLGQGIPAITGYADSAAVLEQAGLERARVLVIALPDALAVRQVVDYCRRLHPGLPIVARTHSEEELEYLHRLGVNDAVLGERELAAEMVRCTLRCLRPGAAGPEETAQGKPQDQA